MAFVFYATADGFCFLRHSGWFLFSTPQRMAFVFYATADDFCFLRHSGWLLFSLFPYPFHNVTSRIVRCGAYDQGHTK
jgi:hypothetical protein